MTPVVLESPYAPCPRGTLADWSAAVRKAEYGE